MIPRRITAVLAAVVVLVLCHGDVSTQSGSIPRLKDCPCLRDGHVQHVYRQVPLCLVSVGTAMYTELCEHALAAGSIAGRSL